METQIQFTKETELSLYLFNVVFDNVENLNAVVAYTLDDAQQEIIKLGKPFIIKGYKRVSVKTLLEGINAKYSLSVPLGEVLPSEKEQMAFAPIASDLEIADKRIQWINNIKMFSQEFIPEGEDRIMMISLLEKYQDNVVISN